MTTQHHEPLTWEVTRFPANDFYLASPVQAVTPLGELLLRDQSFCDVGIFYWGIDPADNRTGVIVISWSQGSPGGYFADQMSSILDSMTTQGAPRYSFYMNAESKLWGVWTAPLAVVSVLRVRSNISESDLVPRINAVAATLQKFHGCREVGYNSNPMADDNEEYVMASGWESLQAYNDGTAHTDVARVYSRLRNHVTLRHYTARLYRWTRYS